MVDMTVCVTATRPHFAIDLHLGERPVSLR